MPQLQALYNQHTASNFQWVPIEASQDPLSDVQTFVKTYGITTPAYFDTTGKVASGFSIGSFPTIYEMGPDGTILNGEIGEGITQPSVYAEFLPPSGP